MDSFPETYYSHSLLKIHEILLCEVIAEVEIDHTAGNLSVLVSNSRVWCFLPALRSRNKRRQGQRIELTIQPPNTAAICN